MSEDRIYGISGISFFEDSARDESQSGNTRNAKCSKRNGSLRFIRIPLSRWSSSRNKKNSKGGKKKEGGENSGDGSFAPRCFFVVNYLCGFNGRGKTLRIDRNIGPRCYLRLKILGMNNLRDFLYQHPVLVSVRPAPSDFCSPRFMLSQHFASSDAATISPLLPLYFLLLITSGLSLFTATRK